MGEVLGKLTDPLVDGAKSLLVHHMCYLIYVTNTVKDLRDTMNVLKAKRKDILKKFALGERELTEPTHEATTWLARVETIEGEVAVIGDAFDKRSCMCVGGCSLNCWSNYWIGRSAAKKLVEAKELVAGVPSDDKITMEVLPPPAQEIPMTSTAVSSGLLQTNFDKALSYLRDDDRATVIGIWGMGGVGKTTLLEKINNSLARDSSNEFDLVIFVTASKGCTIEMLQGKIIKNLGLTEKENATSTISNFLENKNFVLLLDDLWDPVDLLKAGVPHPLGICNQKKRKVILTTRSEDVCAKMGARSSWRIKVECLNWEEAFQLFRENVTEEVLHSHPSIPPLAKMVAEECHGLPLALVTVGRAMCNMRSPQEWNNAISSLQKSRLIPGVDDQVKLFTLLKHSYDYLQDDRMRECFLYCALWPEDYSIEKEELIECWMGHGLLDDRHKFDVHSIQEVYDLGYSIIERLLAACLLEPAGDDHISDILELAEKHVKMHDVMRDMALWLVSEIKGESWMVGMGGIYFLDAILEAPQEERRWAKANKALFLYVNLSTFPSGISTNCTNLSTLVLQQRRYVDNYYQGLTNLHIFTELRYLDLSRWYPSTFPVEICGLVNLEFLNLSDSRIEAVPQEMTRLVNLKYLLLRDTHISELPEELLSNLGKLRVLDMYSWLWIPLKSPSIKQVATQRQQSLIGFGASVSTISDIQMLTQSRTPVRALGMVKFEGPILNLLSPDVLGRDSPLRSTLKKLLIGYCREGHSSQGLIFGENPHDHHYHQTSSSLSLESLTIGRMEMLEEVIWEGVSPRDLFHKLRKIEIRKCPKLKHVTWVVHLPCLEILYMYHCHIMNHVVIDNDVVVPEARNSEERASTFPRLRVLSLIGLPELVSISTPDNLTFPSLEYLYVDLCEKLKKLPSQLHITSNKLKRIMGGRRWWNGLEDDNIRSSLETFYSGKMF